MEIISKNNIEVIPFVGNYDIIGGMDNLKNRKLKMLNNYEIDIKDLNFFIEIFYLLTDKELYYSYECLDCNSLTKIVTDENLSISMAEEKKLFCSKCGSKNCRITGVGGLFSFHKLVKKNIGIPRIKKLYELWEKQLPTPGIVIINDSIFIFKSFTFFDCTNNVIKKNFFELVPDRNKKFTFPNYFKTRKIIIIVNVNNEDFEFNIDISEEFGDFDFRDMEISITGSSKDTLEIDDGTIYEKVL